MTTQTTSDQHFASVGNGSTYDGVTVGSGWDVTIKRESDTVALVNATRVSDRDDDHLAEVEIDAETNLQRLAVQYATHPHPPNAIGDTVTVDDERWDDLAARWDAIAEF